MFPKHYLQVVLLVSTVGLFYRGVVGKPKVYRETLVYDQEVLSVISPGYPEDAPPQTDIIWKIKSIGDRRLDLFCDEITLLKVDAKDGRSLTFGELHAKASAVKERLVRLGVQNEDKVLLASQNSLEAYVFLVGVWLTGATCAPIDPVLPQDEIQKFLEMFESRVVYAEEEYAEKVLAATDRLDWPVTVISPNGVEPAIDLNRVISENAQLVTHVHQPRGRDHCPLVLHTSGTTGPYKVVRFRDEALQFIARLVVESGWLRVLISTPFYWISNSFSWPSCMLAGGTAIISDRASPSLLLQIITHYKPKEWLTGPAVLIEMYSHVEDVDQYDTSSLEAVLVGGAHLQPEQRRLIVERVFHGRNIVRIGCGSTEAGQVTFEETPSHPDTASYASIGKPYPDATLKLVNPENGKLVPPQTPGEICVKSPGVIQSYLNQEISAAELDSDGFWHMGDLGFYDSDDFVYYICRIKEIIKYRGQQIFPGELEKVLQKHPDVVESAVVGRPSPEYGQLPTAFVVVRTNATVRPEELDSFVAERVSDLKKLRGGTYIVDSLPKSPAGKILRWKLLSTLSA